MVWRVVSAAAGAALAPFDPVTDALFASELIALFALPHLVRDNG